MKLLLVLIVIGTAFAAQEYISGEYLLILNGQVRVDALSNKLKADYNIDIKHTYQFSKITILLIKGDDDDVKRASLLPEIKSVDRNMIYHTHQCRDEPHPRVWGLDRTDQRDTLTYTSPISPDAVYTHGIDTGVDVYAYVVDSGIDITHGSFEGRAFWGMNADGLGDTDDNGHGTHCAGTIGSADYGLAKDVTMVAVKVLNAGGSGSTGDIVAGLNWCEQDHTNRGGLGVAKSVINMSLGGTGSNPSMEQALQACIDVGIVGVVSAGNSNADACNFTPAQLPDAITIGATDVEDKTASFTNYGTCVDIFAPGVDVLSAQPGNDTAVFSGTSMSSPHVVGVVSRYLSSQSASPTPAAVVDWLTGSGTRDSITWLFPAHGEESVNLLLYGPCEMASPK